jgi:hypothetical protein
LRLEEGRELRRLGECDRTRSQQGRECAQGMTGQTVELRE